MTTKPETTVEAETQSEIDQILNEVEELRRELDSQSSEAASDPTTTAAIDPNGGPSVAPPVSEEELLKEFHASFVESDSNSATPDSEESVKALLDETFQDQAERTLQKEPTVNKDIAEESPSLTLSLSGSMTLKLKYEFGGQEVTVGFADNCLKVELSDGTEFKIPVARNEKTTLRRVA